MSSELDATQEHHSRYQREKALFLQLLELDEAQRALALAKLKQDDRAMAAIMERRLALNQSQTLIPTDIAPALPEFGRYRAVREIGRGGMGRVWLAERADAVDKQLLAIKQLREECIDKDLQQRFESERRILARLDHPGIVPLLDTGVDSKGYPYLVTPYIEGQAIDVYCREQRLNLRSRVRLVRDMVEALIHAHQQLIVHRDLKPANVLVEKNARVRLLDFGIAKVLGDGGIETNAGSSMMTLRYAAPEQISGGAITVGCDLYAVGVMLFELVGGQSPYGDTRDPSGLINAIINVSAPVLPKRTPLGERIPPDLAAIIAVLLRKKPSERMASADMLMQELDCWLLGEPVKAMRGVRWYRMQSWFKQHWRWVAAVCVLVGLALWHNLRMQAQLARTELALQQARQVSNYMINLFQSAKPTDMQKGAISALDLLKASGERLLSEAEIEMSPTARARMLVATSRVMYEANDFQAARTLTTRAVTLLRQSQDAQPEELAEAMQHLAMSNYALGDTQTALTIVEEALAVLGPSGYPQLRKGLMNSRCVELISLARVEQAHGCYVELVALTEQQSYTREALSTRIASLINFSEFESSQDNGVHAELLAREAQKIIPTHLRNTELRGVWFASQAALANALHVQGKQEDSLVISLHLTQQIIDIDGVNARPLVRYRAMAAITLMKLKRFPEALVHIREAKRIAATIYPAGNFNRVNIDMNWLRWYVEQEQWDAALSELTKLQASYAGIDLEPRSELRLALVQAHLDCHTGSVEKGLSIFAEVMPQARLKLVENRQRLAEHEAWYASCKKRASN